MSFRSVRLSVLVLATVLSPQMARAYVPPSYFLVRSFALKHSGFKTLRIRSSVSAIEGDKPSGVSFKEILVVDYKAKVLRSSAWDSAGKELYAIERPLGTVAESDAAIPLSSVLNELLFSFDARAISQSLISWGVPVRTNEELASMKDEGERRASETEGLARFRQPSGSSVIAWVVGSEPKSGATSDFGRLWIEKDNFLPLRLIKGDTDLRLEGGYRTVKDFSFPKTVSLSLGGKGAIRAELADLSVNGDFKELKTEFEPRKEVAETVDPALRELVRKYYQWMR